MKAYSKIGTRRVFAALVVLLAAISGMSDDDGLCGMSQAELLECKPAVATGSAAPQPPTDACCAALKHANLTCFCTFRDSKFLPLLGINSTRAMELPSICDPNSTAHCPN